MQRLQSTPSGSQHANALPQAANNPAAANTTQTPPDARLGDNSRQRHSATGATGSFYIQ